MGTSEPAILAVREAPVLSTSLGLWSSEFLHLLVSFALPCGGRWWCCASS